MRIHQEASLGIGSILALQVVLSALAIALLTRMGPVIEHVLAENVFSSQAVQEMLAQFPSARIVPGSIKPH